LVGVVDAVDLHSNGGIIWIQMVSKYCEAKRLMDGWKNVQNNDRYDFDEVL
jgi:hypothetical protein